MKKLYLDIDVYMLAAIQERVDLFFIDHGLTKYPAALVSTFSNPV